ncbi:FAD-dependent oxidoreductase [Gracilimonas mengyeensis]|uniref:2-polyprenyl-6-methoxyphenol hydroxylase n=1 Tax=Gracilimonas mengyeensis TaxID=1302730 RepID=A0A521ESU1_9BACT|nr:FAD-dependent monooxygenase [Gracilimonas mengyeensis]SMO86989.1 2-polyprenyl-6-methoxyphenol hydroxylase [Gracilimonas mengyeensis]
MKVAILGGGVAGVSSAIALKQKGFDVSIYERHQFASNIGAGIVLWPNATYVLQQLGVLSEIEAVSGHPARMRRVTSANEELGAINIETINSHMGHSSLSILRSDLQNILISKLESLGISIHYNHSVTGIGTKNPSQAEVHFQNGLKITADVLIGADGRMASHSRLFVHRDNTPVYQDFINWVGVFQSKEEIFKEIAVSDFWGVGERFGIVTITKHKAYWAGGIQSADIGPKNQAKYKSELSSIFSDWPQPIQMMIDHTPVERINKIYVHDHDPIQTWHRNNLIVIGDAAHASLPTSGQGACQALEDAWHLANILNDNQHDLQKAFVKFTNIRFKKTSGMVMAARSFASSLFNRDEKFCQERNENNKKTDFSKVATSIAEGWSQHLPLNA